MENKKLTLEERRKIYQLRRWRYGIRRIARELGRSASTISEELKRNGDVVDRNSDHIAQAHAANDAAHARRVAASRKKMRLKCPTIRHYVEIHLSEAAWSPEIIAGKLTLLGYTISDEAIYQFINVERPDLKSSLLIAGKARRRRRSGKSNRKRPVAAAPKRSIELLSEEAKRRTAIGHLELDALVGKQGKSAIQNKTDRKSRKLFLDKVPCLEAQCYADTLITRMKRSVPGRILKTFLEDNGSEHAEHQRVDLELGTLSHFCHPYCASERGTVENRNKALRRFFAKGSDFDDMPDEYIEWVEDYLNNMPMKILGFKTPNQVWDEELKIELKKAA